VSGAVVGALDVGGTHVTAGIVDTASRSVDRESRLLQPLPAAGSAPELLAAITGAARSIARPGLLRFGVAAPGPFDYAAGVSQMNHKLLGLRGIDLRSALSTALGLRDPGQIGFLNDADAFLLGEWWAGAAGGHFRAVGITLGTGLGAAFMADGRVMRAGRGVPPGGALYELTFRGAPVEETISRRGLLRLYGAAVAELDVEQVAARARGGEALARSAFREFGQALGEFLGPWLQAFEPTCLVVGGSIARSWALFEAALRCSLDGQWHGVVTAAQHLDDAPLLGAARHVVSGPS
jgi:predicted NBD/HSP70 family sugar kinase